MVVQSGEGSGTSTTQHQGDDGSWTDTGALTSTATSD